MITIPIEIAKKLRKYNLDSELSSFAWTHPWMKYKWKLRKNRWIVVDYDINQERQGVRPMLKAYTLDELLKVMLRFYRGTGSDGQEFMKLKYVTMIDKFVYEGQKEAFSYLESLIIERQEAWQKVRKK